MTLWARGLDIFPGFADLVNEFLDLRPLVSPLCLQLSKALGRPVLEGRHGETSIRVRLASCEEAFVVASAFDCQITAWYIGEDGVEGTYVSRHCSRDGQRMRATVLGDWEPLEPGACPLAGHRELTSIQADVTLPADDRLFRHMWMNKHKSPWPTSLNTDYIWTHPCLRGLMSRQHEDAHRIRLLDEDRGRGQLARYSVRYLM